MNLFTQTFAVTDIHAAKQGRALMLKRADDVHYLLDPSAGKADVTLTLNGSPTNCFETLVWFRLRKHAHVKLVQDADDYSHIVEAHFSGEPFEAAS